MPGESEYHQSVTIANILCIISCCNNFILSLNVTLDRQSWNLETFLFDYFFHTCPIDVKVFAKQTLRPKSNTSLLSSMWKTECQKNSMPEYTVFKKQ